MDSPGQRVLLAFMKGKLLIDLAVERKMRIPARFIPKKLCKDLAAILEDAKNSYGIFAVFSGIVPEDLRLWLKTQSQNAPGHTSPFCLVLDYLVNRHGDDFTIFAVYDTLRKMDSPGQHVLLDFMRGRVLLDLAIEEKMKNVPAKRLPSHLRTEIAAILDSCENPPGRDHSSFALHCGISQDKLQVLVEKGNDLDRGPFCTVLDYVIGKRGDEFTIFTVYNILREMASPGQHVLLDFMRDYPAGVPVFSEDWQTCEHFSNAGGQLKAEDSDVILHVPEDAVPPGPTCTTVRGAVSTDLTIIHKELSLNENETIASPVVEYFAGRNHRFLRPVRIVLPHCLPPSYSQDKVRVYRFHRDSFGCTKVEKLDPLKADEDSQTGYFLVPETREVHILTYHFTGYFCTYCNVEKEPPFLRLRLYGKHLHRRTRDVDLWLFIWDTRLDVRDFRKAGFPNPEEEKNCITCKTLDGTRNVAELELGVRLLLSEEEEVKWMHKENRGTPWLPPEKRLQLSSFVPCCKDTIPTRVDWTLRSRPEQTPDRWFECFIEVGYVKEDDAVMRFLDKPQKQILPVSGLERQGVELSAH
nr:hypothetical protein BaRGS_006833 [Batillaria attramentaria]